ncbi:MAG: hypothetical protein IAE84_20160 [Saprospiraceae bacterium]|nr:hypothetical protein [Saprospiraceae bacterium]HRD83011.1 hypothetical protein [Saprospiraceae bacterium]
MNRFCGILLFSAYAFAVLVPPAFKQELGKLDHLLHHYQEHRAETPDMSLIAFLKMHYGEQFATHSADHNHNNLPGKTSQDHTHAVACGCSVFELICHFDWSLRRPAPQQHTLFPTEINLLSTLHASGIWQPPKHV